MGAAICPAVKNWLQKVAEDVAENPTLAVDALQVRSLAEVLG